VTTTITVSEGMEHRVVDAITGAVEERIAERIDEAVRGAIKGALEKRARELVDEKIRETLAAVLEEGWQATDEWGGPKGPKVTLRQRISKVVTSFLSEPDRYDRETPAQKLIKEAIAAELKGKVGEELERARVALREQVDTVLQAKLRESLSSALGLGSRS
jgi:hypothetical protein